MGRHLTLKFEPGEVKRGLWLALVPVWGAKASQVEQMWGSAEVMRAGGESDAKLGLSLAGPDVCGVRLGGRIEIGEWIDLRVEGERTTQAGGAAH